MEFLYVISIRNLDQKGLSGDQIIQPSEISKVTGLNYLDTTNLASEKIRGCQQVASKTPVYQ